MVRFFGERLQTEYQALCLESSVQTLRQNQEFVLVANALSTAHLLPETEGYDDDHIAVFVENLAVVAERYGADPDIMVEALYKEEPVLKKEWHKRSPQTSEDLE